MIRKERGTDGGLIHRLLHQSAARLRPALAAASHSAVLRWSRPDGNATQGSERPGQALRPPGPPGYPQPLPCRMTDGFHNNMQGCSKMPNLLHSLYQSRVGDQPEPRGAPLFRLTLSEDRRVQTVESM